MDPKGNRRTCDLAERRPGQNLAERRAGPRIWVGDYVADLAQRLQTSLRWKFWKERLAVGPR